MIVKISLGTVLLIDGIEYKICDTSAMTTQARGVNNQFSFLAKSENGSEIEIEFPRNNVCIAREDLSLLTVFLTND